MIGDTVWPEVKMEDVCQEITVGFVGPMTAEYRDAGVPFLRSMNIEPFRINKTDLKYISPEFHAKIKKSRLRAGDVVIVRTGDPGTAAVVPEWMHDGNCSDLVIARPGSGVDARFLCYYVNAVSHHIVNEHVVGAVQQHFNVGSAKELKLPLPPLPEQRAIARVLGALDDKIELNRRMNRTLEDLARGLFRSWFVDFDPVTKNGNGKAPAAPAGLFPKRLVDSPIGPIPEGWNVGTVYQHADVIYGAPFASGRFNAERRGLPLLRIRDLADHNPEVWTDEVHPKGTRIGPGDIVVGMDGEFRAHVWRGPECWLNQRMCQFKPKRTEDAAFVLYSIEPPLAEVERSEVGTTVIHLGKFDIDRFAIIQPPQDVLDAYAKVAAPMLDRMVRNGRETSELAATRDALLPQLLSGEIRLNHAEAAVQEVLA